MAFPPLDLVSCLPHTKHDTSELAFPNVICSFLHFGQRTFKNFDLVSLLFFINNPPKKLVRVKIYKSLYFVLFCP